MGSRIEILNEAGFRSDGRRQFELRDLTIDLSKHGEADGSALISHGLTQVLVSVYGPREAKMRSHTFHDRANINVEVVVASFSTGERRKRQRGDKRVLEFAATIKSTFEPVIRTNLYPRSQIDIYVQVLQQDGSTLQTCINAATLALMNAGIPMTDFTLEENDIPHVTVAVMPKTKKVVLVTMETRLHVDRFEEILNLARDAGAILHQEMKEAILARSANISVP
ncbi:exosome component 4 [Ephemerocybe angulata]|uniref:Ribosomal RNA-processing protein 41 n=1 Tax=Ephemerocybe angulata TaxID=980116 RepID=A0A8H6LWS5_9AGAR|nr:exosome component 4 [Tulosesus angulatus]